MRKFILLLTLAAPFMGNSQTLSDYTFYNKGANDVNGTAGVYVQKGALLHIQGDLSNTDAGQILSDGVIELKGNIENVTGSQFLPVNSGMAATDEKVVKFVGDGTQMVRGDFVSNVTGGIFANVVVDKGVSGSYVELQTDAQLIGSLVFGTATTGAATYTPTLGSNYTDNSNKGLIRTYNGTNDHELFVNNGNVNSVKGYNTLGMNRTSSPIDGFVETRGARGVGIGGLARFVNHTGTAEADAYVYPVGSDAKGYQAVRINFATINNGSDKVRGMFCDGATNGAGYVGHVSQYCLGCGSLSPDNNGINVVFNSPYPGSTANPCNPGQEQWVILEDGIKNHGYWSFEASDVSNNSTYSLETFPRNFTDEGMIEPFFSEETWRTMHFSSGVSDDPSEAADNWNTDMLAISNLDDLVTYTRNAGCYDYTKPGVPGGIYTGFSHFAIKKSKSNNALPVELISLTAEPINNEFIQVAWATAVEINNSGFQVLRSTDGVNFTNIGWVDGHNTTTTTQNYTFDDHTAVPNVMYYYKLNQIDNDGHNEETYVVSAMITSGDVFTISEFIPNPAKDASKLIINTSVEQTINVKMFDMLGRQLSQNDYNLSAGNDNYIVFDTNVLSDATYTAVITAGNKVYSKKLVVAKQ